MGRSILLRVQDRSSGRQEHPADDRAVAGSNPAGPTITTGRTLLWNRSSVAQNTRLISGRSQVRVLAVPLARGRPGRRQQTGAGGAIGKAQGS